MNLRLTLAGVAIIAGLGLARVQSQSPAPETPSVTAALQAMKAANKDLLERQEKTLKLLDELHTAAEQLKVFGKRS